MQILNYILNIPARIIVCCLSIVLISIVCVTAIVLTLVSVVFPSILEKEIASEK